MSKRNETLSKEQEQVFVQFRKSIADILIKRPECDDDHNLLRWLRARKFDLKKSVAMFREDIAWREMNKVDTILQDYSLPFVMKNYFPGGLHGNDLEGIPIWIDPNGNIDLKGIIMSVRKQDIIKSKIWLMEEIDRILKEKTQQQGKRVHQITVVFDFENLSMKHLWKPGVDVMLEIANMFEKHYPEILKRCYLINGPAFLPMIYNLFRPILHEDTKSKIIICGSNFKEILLRDIDPAQLPAHWGGYCLDPDGDPRCPSKIVQGGEVPKEHYAASNLDCMSSDFTKTSVGRKSVLALEFIVHNSHSAIRWQFKTDQSDIGFGVYRRGTDQQPQKLNDMEPVLTSERVNSHMVPEDGSVECKKPGTYVVRFDNTYSWFKSKTLYYFIEVLEPQSTHGLNIMYSETPTNE